MPQSLNGVRSQDVYIQDQYTRIVNMSMHRDLGSVTLASDISVGDTSFDLVAGHGASAGESLYLIEGRDFIELIILNVATNTITVDRPIDRAFTTGATATRADNDMNVNGSSTAVTFHAAPPPGIPAWDITQVGLRITDGTEVDNAKFGGISALTNGLLLRKKVGSEYYNVGVAKTNGALLLLCEGEYADKAPAGTYGLIAKCRLSTFSGVTIRLSPNLNEELELVVRDDLSDLTSMNANIIGHVVV